MAKELDASKFWLLRNNPITKTGVFPYLGRQISDDLDPQKIYMVLRPEEELFSDEAVKSFNLIPVSIGHPRTLLGRKEEGFVPAEEKGMDGTTGEASKRDGNKIVNDIKLFSERIKDEINSGKKELSAGYFCEFVPESGTWNGRHYDFVQKNIRGNHIALVEKGRSGSDVRVMDSAEQLLAKTRQFVCDAMDIEGSFDENPNHSPENGQFVSGGGAGGKTDKKEMEGPSRAEPVRLTGDELGEYKDIKELRQKAVEYYKANLQGKTVMHPELGKILFSRKGRDEYEAYSANPDKLKMVVALHDIISKGDYLGPEELHKARKDGAIRFHGLQKKVQIGRAKAQMVKAIVWEDDNGNKFYDLKLPKKELQ